MSFLNPLYEAVAWLLVHIHSGLSHIVGPSAAWSLAIVVLTVAMRLVLFPIFVKQIRSQRAMQVLQPKMKELQTKYKNDKEKLNQEMMALWREAGVNPLSGCLPLLLQIPIFIALWHVLDGIKPTSAGTYKLIGGVSAGTFSPGPDGLIHQAAHAKIFGVPIASAFNSSAHTLQLLNASGTSTKVLAGVMTILMVVTTFITQRQLMARNKASSSGNDQMAQTQKIMLYVFPLFFLIYGYRFPIGVLIYWLTTNLWSMGQQLIVIRRMEAVPATATASPAGPLPGAKPKQQPRGAIKPPTAVAPDKPASDKAASGGPPAGAKPARSTSGVVLPPGGAIPGAIAGGAGAPAPSANNQPRRPANRSNKRKRRGRK